jgi:hypothetical protein
MEEITGDHLRISLAITVGRVPLKYKGKFIEEDHRDVIARAIIEHFQRCRWRVMHEPMPWHSVRYGEPSSE